MSKCVGCGVTLQFEDEKKLGYGVMGSNLCKRCFDLKHYNKNVDLTNYIDNENLLKQINEKKVFTIFLCDLISLSDVTIDLFNKIKNDKLFVLTKVDMVPKNIKYSSLIKTIKEVYNVSPVLFSYKNKKLINELKNIILSKQNVIISGIVSSGKSTLINTLFEKDITTSYYHNTTLDFIEINYEDATIFDTPGFDTKIITSKSKNVLIEKIVNLKCGYEISLNDISFSTKNDVNFVVFMPNTVKVKTKKTINEYNEKVIIPKKSDLVFEEFFIYFKNDAVIYLNNKDYVVRKSIIGKSNE